MDTSDAPALSAAQQFVDELPGEPAPVVPLLVLDTNVVLDWLHFADPSCAALGRAIQVGLVRWLATAAMRQELEHVLLRGLRGRRAADRIAVSRAWDRWATDADAACVGAGTDNRPTLRPTRYSVLRCQDADDQKFVDLALRVNASALLSRDRAVLRLARRATMHGLRILTPADWRPESPA